MGENGGSVNISHTLNRDHTYLTEIHCSKHESYHFDLPKLPTRSSRRMVNWDGG